MVLHTQYHSTRVLLALAILATVLVTTSAKDGFAAESAAGPANVAKNDRRSGPDGREIILSVQVVAPDSESHDAISSGPVLLPLNPPYIEMPPIAEDNGPSPGLEGAVQPVLFSAADARISTVAASGTTALPPAQRTDEPEGSASIDDASEENTARTEPVETLTPAQAELADRLRRTLAAFQTRPLGGTRNTATEIMDYCLPFGCDTEIFRGSSSGQKINAITYLCWNYPCAGYEPLGIAGDHIAARVGYGLQSQPSQLLAVLALSRVKPTYPIRVGEDVRTVADLVESEKLACRAGTDQSLALIGLAHYAGDEATWTNALGEQWTIERMVEEELARPVLTATFGGTDRLMGLSYAVMQRNLSHRPIDGQFLRAQAFLDEYHDYALQVQNDDGSWGPSFLAAKGASRDLVDQILGTGHVLRWLVASLPEDRLDDAQVVRGVDYLIGLLNNQRYRGGVATLSTREISTVAHALSALATYDQRLLAPRTPAAPVQ